MAYRTEPIVIIGSGCRFPGESSSPSKLWQLLSKPRDVQSQIPSERFDTGGFYHPDGLHHGSSNVQRAYILTEDARHFDASFFQIKPIEANSIDPQQRILLETVYEATEAAGIPIDRLRGSNTAVYVGQMCADYSDIITRDTESIPTYFATGTSRAMMSNRVSYFFDWHGPSMTIDTACSSSLVAIHQAVQTLRSGESDVAVAAGANLLLAPEPFIAESKLKMLSPDGRSRMWDNDADGYARGDGIASIVLKTLSKALQDGDNIECLIRQTGINQDGRTKGITMPSSVAQAGLIRDTYAKAGLNLSNDEDRPQYFEAHGTGTKAGDPQEAKAIYSVFFGDHGKDAPLETLHVGSIKTIIGHTEGAAGLAGLMKVSLALQNSVIPPNLLFEKLNPAIELFSSHLHIGTSSRPWPPLTSGQPRRASINSFGFGGTNAHAILEAYEPPCKARDEAHCTSIFAPFVFSANSERSLSATLEAYSKYIKAHPDVNLRDLSHTLSTRRSALPLRASFCSQTGEDLATKLENAASSITAGRENSPAVRSSNSSGSILGVFTGQGAQWATMGRSLLTNSKFARDRIDELERVLATLPDADRPSWSLKAEMVSDRTDVNDASLAQPLTTAVQIILVDFLKRAGITFAAVVGHSSGEIGAALAADILNASSAIYIAYYRGLHAHLASGTAGQQGGMLAVDTSMEDAQELCDLPAFRGRLTVAANNSSSSVTLSGDTDAIEEAKNVFEEEGKFNRSLRVDKAYHSHHMTPCSEPYLKALKSLEIRVTDPTTTGTPWFSSVYSGREIKTTDELDGRYWVRNMQNTVLFFQALENAASGISSFDAAIEVGPHPVLKGPATTVLEGIFKKSIPYTSLLSRGKNDIEAFAEGLGFVWCHGVHSSLNLNAFERAVSGVSHTQLIKDLPPYSWDHDQLYWHQSRQSKSELQRHEGPHELLGVKGPVETDHIQWRNLIQPSEIPWLRDHQIGGQKVFPAAAYVSMAVEACKTIAGLDRDIELIELADLSIGRPITFDDDTIGVEVIFTLSDISEMDEEDDALKAHFTCHSPAGKDARSLAKTASGNLKVIFGEPSPSTLPGKMGSTAHMLSVDTERFYESLSDLGYGYSGPFRALDSLKRYLDLATGVVSQPEQRDTLLPFTVHPAMLDAAFQSALLAHSWPGDGRLWSLHLPTYIYRIQINPLLCEANNRRGLRLPFQTASEEDETPSICAWIDIFDKDRSNAMIQVEGLKVVPFSVATPSDDRQLFTQETWDLAYPHDIAPISIDCLMGSEVQLGNTVKGVANLYFESLRKVFTPDEYSLMHKTHSRFFPFSSHVSEQVRNGTYAAIRAEWVKDTEHDIDQLIEEFRDFVNTNLFNKISANLQAILRGQVSLSSFTEGLKLFEQCYNEAFGLPHYKRYLAKALSQLVHRYPHMRILEAGSYGSGCLQAVLSQIDSAYASYTYTEPSEELLDEAKFLTPNASRLKFFSLDLEDTQEENFLEHMYDIIVVSRFILKSDRLNQVLNNARRLLKPGGYMLMLQPSHSHSCRMGTVFGCIPALFTGKDKQQAPSPCLSPRHIHSILKQTGFSGVDSLSNDDDIAFHHFYVIVSQATDDRVRSLRQPLSPNSMETKIQNLVVIGGRKLQTLRLVEEVTELVALRVGSITYVESLKQLCDDNIPIMSTVLSLLELDEPVFKSLSKDSFEGLKRLFDRAKNILWITRGARADEPYCRAMYGFGRTMQLEMQHVNLQFLDNEGAYITSPEIAEALVRQQLLDEIERGDKAAEVLWSKEPELLLRDGKLMVPRVKPDAAQNDRLNSHKRPIYVNSNPQSMTVIITGSKTGYELKQDFDKSKKSPDHIKIKVSHSMLSPLRILDMYIVMGIDTQSGEKVLALSQKQASIVAVPRDFVIKCDVPSRHEPSLINTFAADVVAQHITAQTPSGKAIVAHNPDPLSATLLLGRATETSVELFITTTYTDVEYSDTAHFIHPYATSREIKALLPPSTAAFVDFTPSACKQTINDRLQECLPASCIRFIPITAEAQSPPDWKMFDISTLINNAVTHSLKASLDVKPENIPRAVSLTEVSKSDLSLGRSSVVSWQNVPSVQIRVTPAEKQNLFHKDKTYLLVGLTGDLGRSLCEWMVACGAKHLVLTSRFAKINQTWIDKIVAAGAIIRLIPSDITNNGSMKELYNEIKSTCPPIAGVANGAMVLNDSSINDMDYDKMMDTLRPKIDGSRLLDALFQEDTLDFFVLFSSLTCACGNSGQANYTAANMFMVGLAEQRKRKGLAGSVIDIGAMMGVGVLVRDRSYALQKQLRDYGYLWMSERDFHHSFAEAVLAGRPESPQSPEVMAGIKLTRRDEIGITQWASNPRFLHCLLHAQTDDDEVESESNLPTRTQLANAASEGESNKILTDAFLSKIRTALGTDADDATLLSQAADDLGVDSLIAVDIRSWWLKEVDVDIPVLKILGGTSFGELIVFAREQFHAGLSLGGETASSDEEGQSQTTVVEVSPPGNTKLVTAITSPTINDSASLDSFVPSPFFTPASPAEKSESQPTSIESRSINDFDLSDSKAAKSPLAIQRREVMSFGQSRFWFLRMYLQNQTTFNIVCSIRLSGNVRVNDLTQAVEAISDKHEAIRTAFYLDEDGSYKQGILARSTLSLETKSISKQTDIDEEYNAMNNYVFDLERGESMRIMLLSKDRKNHQLLLGYHHINMDGISLQVLLSDLEKAYGHKRLDSKILQQADFAQRQREVVANGSLQPELQFWKQELENPPPPLPLLSVSNVTSRQPMDRYAHRRVDFKVPPYLGSRIREASKKNKVTAFHFYLATFKALLYRFTKADEIVIGMADANRNDKEFMESIGFFLNLLPLRLKSGVDEPFTDALKEARTKSYAALSNSRLPFDVLLESLSIQRSASYSPVFQAFINYRQGAQEKLTFGNCELEGERYEVGRTGYDVSLDIIENTGGEASIMFMTQQDLYSQRDTEILANSFQQLLQIFSMDTSMKLGKATLFRKKDVDHALRLSQGVIFINTWQTIIHRIDEVVGQYPQNIALKDGHGSVLTFAQMSHRVNAIAGALKESGAKADNMIAVFQEPTNDWICSLIAILRLGAIYVPLDLRSPLERLRVVVGDCKPTTILAHRATLQDAQKLQAGPASIIDVSQVSETGKDFAIFARPDSPAIVLYTSGSTGVPKGVVLGHDSLAHKIEDSSRHLKVKTPRILQQSAFTFDFSVWQIFMGLTNVGQVYIVPKEKRGDPVAIMDLVLRENISITGGTPSEYISWLRYGVGRIDSMRTSVARSAWKMVIAGGEQISESLKQEFRTLDSEGLCLHNVFGPSEVTIYSHSIEVDYRQRSQERVPVGKPTANYSAVILDQNSRPVPVGIPGEVVISGPGVARGYLNQAELTAEKFISNKFSNSEQLSNGWSTAFTTGDKGRLLDDGVLVLEGRMDGDTQIKLRGIRIDLKNIEATIISVGGGMLEDVIVTTRGDEDTHHLVAHVVFASGQKKISKEDKQLFLEQLLSEMALPQYMIPAAMIPLSRMPLNAHGKIDRLTIKNLPIPEIVHDKSAVDLNEAEEQLRIVWEDIIGKQITDLYSIAPETDFFHVGGNSLLLVKLQNRLRSEFELSLSLVQLFETCTLGSMATRLPKNITTKASGPLNIDWEHETQLPSDLKAPTSKPPTGTPKIVVVTGVSGFLGKALVRLLLADTSVSTVHAIAVRDPKRLHSLAKDRKLRIHKGDLTEPNIGLSAYAATEIFTSASVIIHNAADVSFFKSYHTLARINVESTKHLLRRALPYSLPIHFISTATLAQFAGLPVVKPGSVSMHAPPTNSNSGASNGYAATKWASERLLERANADFGIPVTIHRPSAITGDGAPQTDVMANLLRYATLTGTVPRSDRVRGWLDFVSVESVARGVVESVLGTRGDPGGVLEEGGVRYFFESGEHVVPVDDLKGFLEEQLRPREIRTVPTFGEWVDLAEAKGMDPLVGAYLRSLDTLAQPVVFPRLEGGMFDSVAAAGGVREGTG